MNARAQKPESLSDFRNAHRFWDSRHDAWITKVLPGDFYVSRSDEVISTVLGSCVAACIRDPVAQVGGMNHFLLPDVDTHKGTVASDSARYGGAAMEYLINAIIKYGGRRDRLECKVFGGGNVMVSMTQSDVGSRNVDFVLRYLAREFIAIGAQDLGGDYARKVLYWPMTGAVKMKALGNSETVASVEKEFEYLKGLSRPKPNSGDIELF